MAKLAKQDVLLQVAESIREFAQQHGLVVFRGGDSGESSNHIFWDREPGDDWKAFLECAQALGVKLIYLSTSEFLDFELFELPDEDMQRTFAPRVGQTAQLELSFLFNGFLHTYAEMADWYAQYEELTSGFEEPEDDINDGLPF